MQKEQKMADKQSYCSRKELNVLLL